MVLLYEMDAIRKVVFNKVLCLRLGGNVTWMYLYFTWLYCLFQCNNFNHAW